MEYRYGFKFLSPDGCTYHNGVETQYVLPRPGEIWGPVMRHPEPAEKDGKDCGPGRYHFMTQLSANYAPVDWYPWYARSPIASVVGEIAEKYSATECQVRRISREVWWRMIRMGWCVGANLVGANLGDANLWNANLGGANLRGAYLWGARYNAYTLWPDGFAAPGNATKEE